ncbi:hypothetical protein QTP70_018513, partial [Hemibagrus guttatus]
MAVVVNPGLDRSAGPTVKPSVSLLPPSSLQLSEGSASLLCLLSAYSPQGALVSWTVDGSVVKDGVVTSAEEQKKDGYTRSSTLTLSKALWEQGEEFVCKDALKDADWDMLQCSFDDINMFTEAVVGLIGKLADDTMQKTTIRTFPNQKPWVDKTIRIALRSRAAAYNAGLASGDMDSYKASSYKVRKAVKEVKQHYERKLESQLQHSDSRSLWQGLRTITDYKAPTSGMSNRDASLTDELNTFYARFEAAANNANAKANDKANAIANAKVNVNGCRLEENANTGNAFIIMMPHKLKPPFVCPYLMALRIPMAGPVGQAKACLSQLPGLPYTLFLRTCDLADSHYTMERRDRRAHGFGIAGRRPLRRSLRRCFESARLLRFVAELSRFLSDVLDNLPALAEASPLQSGPDDVPDPDAVPDMPDPDDVSNPDDEPDLADEPEPDALNLAGRGYESGELGPEEKPPPSHQQDKGADSGLQQERNYQILVINESPVARVDNFRYLSVHITQDLSWSCHINTMVKTARQRLYHLRHLRDFRLLSKMLRNFYCCTIESILTGNIATSFGNSTMQDRRALQRVVRSAECIIRIKLPDLHSIYNKWCWTKARKIVKDLSHPNNGLFFLLWSGKHFRSLKANTERLRRSFFLQ